jgi:hypothetical protein
MSVYEQSPSQTVGSLTATLHSTTHAQTNKCSHLGAVFTSFTVTVLLSDKVSVISTPTLGLILPGEGDSDRGETAFESDFRLSVESVNSSIQQATQTNDSLKQWL